MKDLEGDYHYSHQTSFQHLEPPEKWHILQTPRATRANQCGVQSYRRTGSGPNQISLLTCHAGTCFSSRLGLCSCDAPYGLLGTGHWWGALGITTTLPGAILMSSLYIGCLESKQCVQSFPNLDMELARQTPDLQPWALSHTPSV